MIYDDPDNLKSIDELHNQAMTCAEKAYIIEHGMGTGDVEELYREALFWEGKVVTALQKLGLQPSLAIICRSAAELAMKVENYSMARHYAEIGLQNNPPRYEISPLKDLRNVAIERMEADGTS